MVLSQEYGYGYQNLYFPPTLTEVEKISDGEILLKFDYVEGGIKCPDTSEIVLIDDNWNLIEDYIITVEGDKIRIKSETDICIIRYNCLVENVFGENVHMADDVLPVHAFAVKIREPEITAKKSSIDIRWVYGAVFFVIILAAVVIFVKKGTKKGDK